MTQPSTRDVSVLIIGALLPSLQEAVETHFDATRFWELPDQNAWLAQHGDRIKAIVTSGALGASSEVIGKLPNLEAIFSFGVGYDSIAVDAARDRGIVVTNTPAVLDDCVADTAMALTLDVMRRYSEADRFVRAGKWTQGKFPLASKIGGKKIGIVGLGNIGESIAKRAAAFDMHVLYHNRKPKPGVAYQYYADLDAMITDCDVLVLAVPGGKSTEGLIDAKRIDLLGSKGFLVNIARGSVVDQSALIQALSDGRIAGAGLDVYEDEPNVPQALIDLHNVVLLPHLASGTHETRQAMGDLVWSNIQAYFHDSRKVLTPVG
ncbi:2-hydroxyacid dehydrogenase [Pseudomonas rhizosphaerae]|jgi:hydroxypyruvate reductase|uniref:Hydroxyacid dehydrogenase n=1 Tax=Pseudomonas rhizosphaerae TaxID=216142 RepID=A0A089ZQM3_9PSED|nr:2-hydroxyacid dehydrogenase [Pseudomonas rhizosphaerae]AIS17881.1 hydroxyacid dehydrogenase [Pseudomonas rhizosphaerae]MBD8614150.1 2-hydroxyacid dehydrogenase [Pseudomonas putida]MEB2869981.1 2-hydroxyacid dehydrogenase [Pseudomonas rhizosphaerae]